MPDIRVDGKAEFEALNVTVDTSALQDVTGSRGTFTDVVQVSVNGKMTKINGLASASGPLVAGGWISGHTDGLNITPNDDGVPGKKLVLAYFNDSGYQSAIEFANVSGTGLTSIVITPTVNFGNDANVTGLATVSRLRISGGPTTKASNATGLPGEEAWDANYSYKCTATNTWKRVALTGGY